MCDKVRDTADLTAPGINIRSVRLPWDKHALRPIRSTGTNILENQMFSVIAMFKASPASLKRNSLQNLPGKFCNRIRFFLRRDNLLSRLSPNRIFSLNLCVIIYPVRVYYRRILNLMPEYRREAGDLLISYALTFMEGILTFISPCILPMLPIYFIYLAGTSESRESALPGKNRMLANSIGFVIGFTIVFIILGATVTAVGRLLENNRLLLQRVSGLIMVLFALNFTGILKISFLNTEKRFHLKTENIKFLSSIVFGMVFGFGWTPCLGAFLGSALMLAGNAKTVFQGILLLLVYSIGLGIPFIITSIVFENAKGAFKRLQKHSRVISILSGILLIAAGLLVFFDILKYLN